MIKIGVDAGGTLIKAAYMKDASIEYKTFSVSQLALAAEWINQFPHARICVTGGKAMLLKALTDPAAPEMVEFEATYQGARYLLDKEGLAEESHILTNVGTGTSIHYLGNGKQHRVGGTGVGGGTIMGLSQLLTGLTDFDEIVRLAALGDRDRIDLKVSHIYEGRTPPISGDLTASNFGRLSALASSDSISKEELLASVIGLVGETVATASVLAAAQFNLSSILFIGSSFNHNDPLKRSVEGYTRLRGAEPLFIGKGEYCGAIGALLNL
ncbi:type II pantothenate kinase [Paenibacillus nasutitermitis]|uniref:Type II pantothenate kinase n=1 Tax=Paenibacillus nasutitermitis TaxID=1652958 RepID=A0A917DZG5_9BACL|nr:type II pantothenate kinase [Paenibacillus nasutitermitis]GGD81594.1 type II pantothenate kinase [Paenibacillus nasutitermitis]